MENKHVTYFCLRDDAHISHADALHTDRFNGRRSAILGIKKKYFIAHTSTELKQDICHEERIVKDDDVVLQFCFCHGSYLHSGRVMLYIPINTLMHTPESMALFFLDLCVILMVVHLQKKVPIL